MNETILLLALAIAAAAALYSSVGHGGASAYIALMALAGLAPEEVRPAALVLNILVAGFGAWRYCSSTNELNRKGLAGMKKAARDKGESWLVIESDTGTVVDSLLVPDMDPNLKAHLVEAP